MCNVDIKRTWKENLLILLHVRKQCGMIHPDGTRCQFLAKWGSDFCPWNFINGRGGDDPELQSFAINYESKCINFWVKN